MQRNQANFVKGVDVSTYQGSVNFDLLKRQGVKWVIARAYGSAHTSSDTAFVSNVREARARGMLAGGYYFANPAVPRTTTDAQTQASQFITVLQSAFGTGKYGDIMPVLDVEETGSILQLSYADLSTWVLDFKNYFESQTGRKLMLYTSQYFMETQMKGGDYYTANGSNPLSSMPIWLSEYTKWYATTKDHPDDFMGWTNFIAWQYSENGLGFENGVKSIALDLDYAVTIESLRLPYQVANISAVSNANNTIVMTFNQHNDTDVSGYNIYLNGVWKDWIPYNQTSYTFTGLTSGATTTVGVRANDYTGNNSDMMAVSVVVGSTTPVIKPSKPKNVSLTRGNKSITVAFDRNEEANASYNIYLNGTLNHTVASTDATSYTISGLTNGTEYNVTVEAVVNTIKSDMTDTFYITPRNIAPTNVNVTPSNGKVTLTWTEHPDTTIVGYSIYENGNYVAYSSRGTTTKTLTVTNGSPIAYTIVGQDSGSPTIVTVESDPVWAVAYSTSGSMTQDEVLDHATDVTAQFETSVRVPEAYEGTSGDFDGQGMSHGFLQFNLGSQSLQPIFKDMLNLYPSVVLKAFNNDTARYNEFRDMMLTTTNTVTQQVAWASKYTDPNNKHQLLPPWQGYFRNMGATPEEQSLQKKYSADWRNQAKSLFTKYGLKTRRGLAFAFDVAVQNWSVRTSAKGGMSETLDTQIAGVSSTLSAQDSDTQRMGYIRDAVVFQSSSAYQSDVRTRKQLFITGTGTVHGLAFNVADYQLTWDIVGGSTVTPPTQLTGFKAIPMDGKAMLTWNSPTSLKTSGVGEFRIYQNGTLVDTIPYDNAETLMQYDVEGLTNGTSYSFQVSAYNGAESTKTTAISVTPTLSAPLTPIGFVGLGGDGQATLMWRTRPVTTTYGYNVYKDGTWVKYVAGNQNSVVITGLTNGTAYKFKIDADNGKLSSQTAEITVTPNGTGTTTPIIKTTTQKVTYAGKVKGDTDTSRYIYYAYTGTSELPTSSINSEVVSGYANISSEDTAKMTYSITSGTNAHIQFMFKYKVDLTDLNKLEMKLKGVAGQPFTLRAWNVTTSTWDTATTVTYDGVTDAQFVTSTITSNFANYIDSNGYIRYSMYSTNAWTTGTLTLSSDYAEFNKTYLVKTPSAPTNVAVTQNTTFQAVVSWNAVTSIGFDHYRVYSDGVIVADNLTTTSTSLNVSQNVQHVFSVEAVNTYGDTAKSVEVTYTIVNYPTPNPPQSITLTENADNSVTVSWIQTYTTGWDKWKIYKNGSLLVDNITDTTNLSYRVLPSDITIGTSTQFNVVAVSKDGKEAWSNNATITVTDSPVPNAPVVTLTEMKDNSIKVDWTHTSTQGFQYFKVFYSGTSKVIATNLTSKTYTIPKDQVLIGQQVQVNVIAVNDENEETWSQNKYITVTDSPVPNAPYNISVNYESNFDVTLTWFEITSTGFSHYRVEADNVVVADNLTTNTATISGLTHNKDIAINVIAVNDEDEEAKSQNFNINIIDYPVPNAPTNLVATLRSDRTIKLDWSHVTTNGFKEFDVYKNGAKLASTVNKTYTFEGLTLNTPISFYVVAKNMDAIPNTAQSTTIQKTVEVPVAPRNIAVNENDTIITLSWTPNSETFVTGYNVYRDGDMVYTNTTGTSIAFINLQNGIDYKFEVEAVTNVGIIGSKSTIIGTPILIIPDKATINSIETVNSTSMRISWLAPTTGEAFDHYKLYRDGIIIYDNIPNNVTSYTVTDLQPNVSYAFNVVVVDATNDENWGTQAYHTINLPKIPTGLDAFVGDGTVGLKWESNSENFVNSYNVYKDGTLYENVGYNGVEIKGLTNGQVYSFYITAVSDQGLESTATNSVTATPMIPTTKFNEIGQLDMNKKPILPRLFLAKPNGTTIARLSEAYSIALKSQLGQTDELSFNIPYGVEVDNQLVDNKNIDLIKDRFIVRLELGTVIENFIIDKVTDTSDDSGDYKVIDAFSLGYELKDKIIRSYASQVYVDSDGDDVADKWENGSIDIHTALEDALVDTIWSVGTIDDIFVGKFRQFSVDSSSVLDFIFQIADTFKAILDFDTIKRVINVLDPIKVGQNKGLKISYGKYLNTLTNEHNTDDMTTRLKPYGANGLTINAVTPTGTNYIEDLSYFIYPYQEDVNGNVVQSSAYMSNELASAELRYANLVNSHERDFSDMLAQLSTLNATIDTNYTTLYSQQSDMAILQDTLDIAKSTDDTETINATNIQIQSKQFQIDSTTKTINDLQGQIDTINTNIGTTKDTLSLEKNFTPDQIKERNMFIIEKEWSDDNYDNANDLYADAKVYFDKIKQPQTIITIDTVNFLEIVESQNDWNKLVLGDFVTIRHDRLGTNVIAQLTEIDHDFEQGTITLTIANTKDAKTDEEKIIDLLYNSQSTSTTVDMNKYKWSDIETIKQNVNDLMTQEWDATKKEIIAGVNESVSISSRGILIKDSTDPQNMLIAQNGVLAISNDGGETWKNSLTHKGLIAERVIGQLIAGENLSIINDAGKFTFDKDGVVIQGTSLTITGGIDEDHLSDGLSTTINGKVDSGTYTSDIGEITQSLNGKVDTGTYTSDQNSLDTRLNQMEKDASSASLINNTTVSGTINAWSGGVTLDNQNFFGVTVPVQKAYSNGNMMIKSDSFVIDPTKAYEISLWMKSDSATLGTDYFGIYVYDANGVQIGVDIVRLSDGVVASPNDTNPYAWNGHNDTANWTRRTTYIMPVGTNPTTMKGLGTNVTSGFIFYPNAKTMVVRYLNYYNTTGAFKTLWVANPRISEVPVDMKNIIDVNTQSGKDAWAKFSGLNNTLPSGAVEFNYAGATTKGGNATNTDNVGTQSASTIATAVINYNTNNDRKSTTPANPVVLVDGTAVDHVVNFDGSVDISFEWQFNTGNLTTDAYNIDGFIVYVFSSDTNTPYSFGTNNNSEMAYYIPSERRAFILQGVTANKYYTFGVQAYRDVDSDIAPTGVLKSSLVKSSLAQENPYQPSTTIAFKGSVVGTIDGASTTSDGTPISSLVTLAKGSVQLATNYYGVQVTSNSGIVVTKTDNTSRAVLNADGFKLQSWDGTNFVDKVYADATGRFYADDLTTKNLQILAGDGTVLLDASQKTLNQSIVRIGTSTQYDSNYDPSSKASQTYVDQNTMVGGVAIGGAFTGQFQMNMNYSGTANDGEIMIDTTNGSSFTHPNGLVWNVETGKEISTHLEGSSTSSIDIGYIMYVGSTNDTSVTPSVNSRLTLTTTNGSRDFVLAFYKNGSWFYDDNTTTLKAFTPNANDCIVARVGRSGLSVAGIDIFALFAHTVSAVELQGQLDSVYQDISEDSLVNTVTGSTTFANLLGNYVDVNTISGYASDEDLATAVSGANKYTDTAIGGLVYATPNDLTTQISQNKTDITNIIKNSGGVNVLKNSIGYNDTNFWTVSGYMDTVDNPELLPYGGNSGFTNPSGFGGYIEQTVSGVNADDFTVSFYMNKSQDDATYGKAGIEIYGDGALIQFIGLDKGQGKTTGYAYYKFPFTTTAKNITIRVTIDTKAIATITGLMLNYGLVDLKWTPHPEETYSTNIKMDGSGIKVFNDDGSGSYTQITTKEFAGYGKVEGQIQQIFTLNGDTTHIHKVNVDSEINMNPVKIVPIISGGYSGWAFIASE
jgi:GH25 family lysozyme M1 (1,4-beta-N-acetylmuramidase)